MRTILITLVIALAPATQAGEPGGGPLPDLGDEVQLDSFEAARYAASLYYHQFSSCSRSWSDYVARASFVLSINDDGSATACRGRKIDHAYPDGKLHVAEQQGFSGTWQQDGAWIEVRLALDDRTCKQRRGYQNLDPKPWHLRCLVLEPLAGRRGLPGPALACRFATRVYTEELGYAMPGPLPGEWLLLGKGDGFLVKWDDAGPMRREQRSVKPATRRLEADEWTREFRSDMNDSLDLVEWASLAVSP